ncbi:MAG: molybdopterin-dependent oxidoreductase [Geminicoccaceae bacterium]|jgi:anaerobic selenocysteine-containing dehydrogenase|nr:molybdopterin-dependent oxidoreductase [Geminicoccaceae bacterium]
MTATIDTSPKIADEIVCTTCYMCACRCGIRVHKLDGEIRYIDGNPEHPVNRGVLCAKGSAGIMHHNSPARLTKPLKRVGERGEGRFEAIEWDEALAIAEGWLRGVRETDPRQLAFFTGRDQSQALTGFWASQFGTCNYAAHGGFCSVNMAAAGLYTIGGSFWEFGEPDFEHARYFLIFGVAEDHDSNPLKLGMAELKKRGAKIVSVNPIRTGYSAIADEWIGIRPGTDGLFVMSLMHELINAGRIDVEYLRRYSNATALVIDAPGDADDGLLARDGDGRLLVGLQGKATVAPTGPAVQAALQGRYTLADGRAAVPVFELLARRYAAAEYSPDAVAERCGIPAATIRRIAAELAAAAFDAPVVLERPWTDTNGMRHERMIGRPVAMHAMRGISAHSNGFHTCRAIHLLQVLLGTIDTPGGFRFKTPFPRPTPPGPQPAGRADQMAPGKPMAGPPLGFPRGPADLILDEAGGPRRIDKAFSWDAPISAHGMMHSVIGNAFRGDPYRIDVLFMFMANMAWNSAMNTTETMAMLEAKNADGSHVIPKIIYADAFYSETVAYADLVLPDTTYLERHDCISLLDRPIGSADAVADAIRQPVEVPDRDVRPFQDVLIDLGARLGLPAFVDASGAPRFPGGYADYMVNHERKPGVGSLAGWRGPNGDQAGKGAVNPDQLERYKANGCFFSLPIPEEATYFKHANAAYLKLAVELGLIDEAAPITMQLYCEPLQRFRLAARGHGALQPPASKRERIETYFDPLPIWYMPFDEAAVDAQAFPLHAVTQRPMFMYHSWGGQNPWLRQILDRNALYLNRRTAAGLGIEEGDRVAVTSRHGRVEGRAKLMDGVHPSTVWTWNAIGKRRGAWGLQGDIPEASEGFLLNSLIDDLLPEQDGGYRYANADPITGQAAWYDLRVRVEKLGAEARAPEPAALARPPGAMPVPETLSYRVRGGA